MAIKSKEKIIIGCAEKVRFPAMDDAMFHARIDTGAKTSSIWASVVAETPEGLAVQFMDASSEVHAKVHLFKNFERVRVASSMGHEQIRYKVKFPIVLHGRNIVTSFTLADRSLQVYPVLVGRNTLKGAFIVDVSRGTPLTEKEKQRSAELQQISESNEDEL